MPSWHFVGMNLFTLRVTGQAVMFTLQITGQAVMFTLKMNGQAVIEF